MIGQDFFELGNVLKQCVYCTFGKLSKRLIVGREKSEWTFYSFIDQKQRLLEGDTYLSKPKIAAEWSLS